MTVVTEFDAMTQNAQEEERLWSAYIVAVSNKDRLVTVYEEAWRNHVKVRSSESHRLYQEAMGRADDAQDLVDGAYGAWKRVAYPLHGWRLDVDELSS